MENNKLVVLAVIPARGGSKSIIKKNLVELNGIPLVVRTIRQAMKCRVITDVVVTTDDKVIADYSNEEGVTVLARPDRFSHDNTIQEVDRLLCWVIVEWEKLKRKKIDVVVLLYPTSPLRKISTIELVSNLVIEKKFDSALSLVEDKSYIWKVDNLIASPVNYNPKTRGPRQLENWNQWIENKSVYSMSRDLIMETGCRLGGRISYVAVSKIESIDIDSQDDLDICNAILNSGVLKDELLN